MLTIINQIASGMLFALSLWALLSHRVPTRSMGTVVLFFVNSAALGNIGSVNACHSAPEVVLNTAVAAAALWGFWQVQVRHRVIWGHQHGAN